MKKLKVIALSVLAFVTIASMVFVSCQKSVEENKIIKVGSSNTKLIANLTNLQSEMITAIGNEHNRLCKLIQEDYMNSSNSDLYNSFNNVMQTTNYGSIDNNGFNNLVDFNKEANFEINVNNLINSIKDVQEKEIMNSIYLATLEIEDLDKFNLTMNELEVQANSITIENRKIAVLIAIEVARNSSKMWMPIAYGGEGYYIMANNSQQNLNKQTNKSAATKKVGGVVLADIIGAYTGFLGGVMGYLISGGPVNPASNAYIAGCTIVGGVGASVSKAMP
jgi:hypothetical protein